MERITLKNVKHSRFSSQETECFEASVYLDNKRVARAYNDGHGGLTVVDFESKALREKTMAYVVELNPKAVDKYEDVVKEDQPWPYPDDWFRVLSMTKDQVLEAIIDHAVTDWLITKDIKNDLRHRWVAIKKDSDDASLLVYGKKQKAFAGKDIEQIKGMIEEHASHEVEIINGWRFEDIRAAYELAETNAAQ